MNGFTTMLKMNIKLLLRNKGYLCFLIILPLLAILFLNLPNANAYISSDENYLINELKTIDETVLSMTDTKLSVMVYDASASTLSDYVLEELVKTGSVSIYRHKIDGLSVEDVEVQAVESANKSNFAAILYIPNDFDEKILKNKPGDSLTLYEITADGRITILKDSINTLIQNLSTFSALVNGDEQELHTFINDIRAQEIKKEIVSVEVGDHLILDNEQQAQTTNIGYSLAVITLSSLLTGIFIASVIVEEKDKMVLTRVLLTDTSISNYVITKMLLALFTVIIQTVVMGIGILLFVKNDFGISLGSYLLFIGGLGLIFNFLSVVVGTVSGNVLSASYITYSIWCISALLSGLFFPISNMPEWFGRISLLTPQRWVIRTSELLLTGSDGVYTTYLLAISGFLAILFCVGAVGIKINNKE